ATAAAGEDRSVDADDLPACVDERTAGVAGVVGGVGLDHVQVVAPLAATVWHELAAERADDAGGHRRFRAREQDAEGIADGNDPFADHQVVGVPQRRHWQGFGTAAGEDDPEHGEVADFVEADDLGREFPPVGEGHGDFARTPHHVLVRQHDAGLVYDEAGAEAGYVALQPPGKEHLLPERSRHHPLPPYDVYRDHGRRDPLRGDHDRVPAGERDRIGDDGD